MSLSIYKLLISTAVTAVLVGQVCHAFPTSISAASIAARDDAALVPGLYGSSGGPEIDDLVEAVDLAISEYHGEAGQYVQWSSGGLSSYSIDLKRYNRVLFGFLKCQQAWIESWFPNADEMKKLKNVYKVTEDSAVFLRYDENDHKRHPVIVSRGWADHSFTRPGETSPASTSPWWSWAALQGAYGDKPEDLQMADIVMAISGEKLVPVKIESKDDYWKTLIDGHKTPVWVDMGGSWFIVMSTQGDGPVDGSVTLAQLMLLRVNDEPRKFSEWRDDISEVYILEGMPTFVEGQERKGEITY